MRVHTLLPRRQQITGTVERGEPHAESWVAPTASPNHSTDRSSLGGSIASLQTFTGGGLDVRIVPSVGYFVRF